MNLRTPLMPCALLLSAVYFSPAAFAQDAAGTARDYLHISAGLFDVGEGNEAVDFRAEYRPAHDICAIKNFRPFAGLELTHEGSVWLGGGVLYNFNLTPQWSLTPSLGAGYYAQGNSDLDLDFPLIFRTQLEAAYTYDNDVKLTLSFAHLSNASLSGHNPGTEVISLGIGYPF